MSVSKAIQSILEDDAGVGALVGNDIYQQTADQNEALPYIIHDILGTEIERTKDGATGIEYIRVQLTVYAATYKAVDDIREACRTALDETSGTYESITVQQLRLENEDDANFNEEVEAYEGTQVYLIRRKR